MSSANPTLSALLSLPANLSLLRSPAGAQWLRDKAGELRVLADRSHREQLLYLAMSYERLARVEEVHETRVHAHPALVALASHPPPPIRRHFAPLMPPPPAYRSPALPPEPPSKRERRDWLARCFAFWA